MGRRVAAEISARAGQGYTKDPDPDDQRDAGRLRTAGPYRRVCPLSGTQPQLGAAGGRMRRFYGKRRPQGNGRVPGKIYGF